MALDTPEQAAEDKAPKYNYSDSQIIQFYTFIIDHDQQIATLLHKCSWQYPQAVYAQPSGVKLSVPPSEEALVTSSPVSTLYSLIVTAHVPSPGCSSACI